MSDADALQKKLQTGVDAMVKDIDSKYLRPRRKKAFLDMAACCDSSPSQQAYQACIQRASLPEEKAQVAIKEELNHFQDRLQRAAAACQDEVKDKSISDPDRAQLAFNKCLCSALEKHIKMLPTMQKRIFASLDANK
mmetsp:Transcript_20374/g.26414  ORF Transcript_20374/g.26414 Transcript_20374/m.26414 type:complete len:137 (+) Transcript_20374:80-490(+)|eukprot:CAMPEP_0197286286 /NCGR_PEP_ID=MMETSP0890-20130614/1733_1 /TAXON_ID=44058 ORGANISM="Aureoumbra lagunensis, Strain CCMP1510" /NCGR_SAMPLE_ID=MMETSP0890 /ASSEMBLY_ACC=CAM_ASM_000533 /LENGTH=136 /DNA_ID=CAMNT_0042754515 /DNA_START=10 /DNA_END=420 /DNA_ORIENTATION=-